MKNFGPPTWLWLLLVGSFFGVMVREFVDTDGTCDGTCIKSCDAQSCEIKGITDERIRTEDPSLESLD